MGVVQNVVDKVKAKAAENDAAVKSIGSGLAEKQANIDAYKGATTSASAPPADSKRQPAPWEKVGPKKYGDRAGEKRIDTTEMTKPLGSFAKGTDSVPKTGIYKIHEGEAVVPKDKKMSEHTPKEKAHFHRAMSHLHTGALHRHLGIPEDQPIPMEKKQEAANSDNPHVAAMGRLAVAMHGWRHGKK